MTFSRLITAALVFVFFFSYAQAVSNDSTRVSNAITLLENVNSNQEIAAAALLLRGVGQGEPRLKKAEQLLIARLDNPIENDIEFLGEGYRYLFWKSISEENVSESELLHFFQRLIKSERSNPIETFSEAPIALALHTSFYEEAKSGILNGLSNEMIDPSLTFHLYDALGRILLIQGQKEESVEAFEKAETILPKRRDQLLGAYWQNKKTLDHFIYYGDACKITGHTDKAEMLWKRALSIKVQNGEPISSSNTILKRLQTINGSTNISNKDYLEHFLQTEELTIRKADILGTLLSDSIPCPDFTLRNLQGNMVSLKDLKGKIIMINYWATWCGPCVKELPDIQEVVEKYQDSPDVVILTINGDSDPHKISQWLKNRNLEIPVLFDDRHQTLDRLRGTPITNFVDQNGQIRFQVLGSRHRLVQEFTWRIEALRN